MEDWVSRANALISNGLKESDQLKNSEWTFEEEKHNAKIYTRPFFNNPVHAGKGETEFAHSAEEMFNFFISMPLETRWGKGNLVNPIADDGPASAEIVAEEGSLKLIFIVLQMKWPVTNREFIYIQDYRTRGNSYVIFEKSLEVPEVPITEGCVRATLNLSTLYIEPISDTRCKVTYLVNLDPCGDILDAMKEKIQLGWSTLIPAILHQHVD
ncbi:unnamed protein product [Blepharisma stoltei]|uniref:START domain-containing protein n=1 Tax=Blepharisma stoltei TaxID=1481888 RepID=A0AAU9IXS2_9CILI|nr:unnamed protein product [Blepharisma stoltei]